MVTFDKHKLPLPLNTRLSYPSMSTPTHRISNHHKNHTWRLLHSLLHTSTNNNTHTTKRATCHQKLTVLNNPTVVARNQQATKRDFESSYITNGQTCNADLRRLRPLPGP